MPAQTISVRRSQMHDLRERALRLPPLQREMLVQELLTSLEPVRPRLNEIDTAWIEATLSGLYARLDQRHSGRSGFCRYS